MAEKFTEISVNFMEYYRRQAYLHLYTDEGMEEQQFYEAEANVSDSISEFRAYAMTPAEESDFEY